MKIALAQLNMKFEDKTYAMERCREMTAQAAAQGAEVIVFPEMTLTGFTMSPQVYGETKENSPSLEFFREEARKYAMAIVCGIIFLEDGKATNHSVILSETGEVLADYAKIHPFSYGAEARYYTGGTQLASCVMRGVPTSPFVCYDLRFPEIFQAASKKSLLLTVIANWPIARISHWQTLLQARALENQCFVAGVNRSGKDKTLTYTGDSMLISPEGEVLAHLTGEDALQVVEIDPAQAEAYRKKFPLKADRKEDLYCRFFRETK